MSFLCTTINKEVSYCQCVNECQYFFKSACIDKMNEAYQQGRTDAIDECISKLENLYSIAESSTKYPQYDHYCNGIEDCIDMLEQLKEQNTLTCFDCKHHFMSDCYLECNKHNRINNNQICEDFEHLKEQK